MMVGQVRINTEFGTYGRYWYRQSVVNELAELSHEIKPTKMTETIKATKKDEFVDYELDDVDDEVYQCRYNPFFLPCHIERYGTELFSATIRFFGSWQNALYHSGLGFGGKVLDDKTMLKFHKNFWDQDRILEHIRILYTSRFELSAGFIKLVYPELYFAAVEKANFNSWSEALYESGINGKYLKGKKHRFWTLARILQAVIELEDTFGNIQSRTISEFNPSLYISSRRYFKHWSETVRKANLNIKKNKVKVYLEPFREYLVGEYLKLVFDKLQISYRTEKLALDMEANHEHGFDLHADTNIAYIDELPKYCLVVNEGRGLHKKYIVPLFRSWCVGLENVVEDLLNKFSNVTFYHSIGEPRNWQKDKVSFESINIHYPELLENGEDLLVSDLCLIARGGVPSRYQGLFDKIMKEIMEIVKK